MCEQETKIAWNQDKNSIFCSDSTHKKMNEILDNFGIPDWILHDSNNSQRKCNYCSEDFTLESIRGINICLNAQHIGDIQVEILCQSCSGSYFLHFKKECGNILDFSKSLLKSKLSNNNPVLLSDIKPSENNLSDLLILDDQNRIREQKEYQPQI